MPGRTPIEIPPCKCGSEIFIESQRCWGWWKSQIDRTGEVDYTDLDDIRYSGTPKTVVCGGCGRRNPNPRYLQEEANRRILAEDS